MFFTLLKKEMLLTFKSLTYLLFVVCLAAFIFLQIGTSLTPIAKPQPGQESYGMMPTKNQQLIQEQTYGQLFSEYTANQYATYPFGFIKNVKLSEKEQAKVAEIIEQATGRSIHELEQERDEQEQAVTDQAEGVPYFSFVLKMPEGHSYKQFKKDMAEIVKMVGGGSDYELAKAEAGATEPKTYEVALNEYQQIIDDDHVSGAYARMVCDYFGIILGLLPVFLAATVMLRDKRAQASQVIYTKAISSGKLIGARFISTILLIMLPVLIMAFQLGLQSLYIADKLGTQGDLLLFYKYLLGWLTPSVFVVVGLSFLLTELFGGIASIVVQLGWWFFSLFMGAQNLTGLFGMNLIPRFNTVGSYAIFEAGFSELVVNRLVYLGIGLVCFILTIICYERKRRGGRLL